MTRAVQGALLALALGSAGCEPDDCHALPTSFQLDIELEDGDERDLVLLRVDLDLPTERRRRFFRIGDTFLDRETSLAVELDPPLTASTTIGVALAAWTSSSTATPPRVESREEFDLGPDGCNRFRMELNL